jgi:aryl-alcohol dehydrogenase-like predicted oxidoreductase
MAPSGDSVDYLDIVYCEQLPASLPMRQLVGQLDRIIASGKLRAWGVLNWSADQIAAAIAEARANGWRLPVAAQLAYSVLTRSPVEDEHMARVCRDARIGVVASYSLQGGLLSGKYRGDARPFDGRLVDHLQSPAAQAMMPKVDAFVAIAQELGCTPSQLALAYCLKNANVSSVLFGTHASRSSRRISAPCEYSPH